MPASVGDPIFYNESSDPDVPAWTVGTCAMTDTVPSNYDDINAEFGYPSRPGSGQILAYYAAMLGTSQPQSAGVLCSEGTGPFQYSTTSPF